MCHPGMPPGCEVKRRRAPPGAGLGSPPVPRREQPRPRHYCVCSPTAHRGSFRCGAAAGTAAATSGAPPVAAAWRRRRAAW
ncbi:hypothetical protein GUJ93_ZPchr0007g5730 [Zizania palustris]|uniref:Uncharacterized protein n=1 Tax=Zizania palustris TaxID=103762 RepID=A0A8J5T3M0_ZIZPA|nr:hypothetical protein GUJ93_ZPchr0007g5730 [Zizania palustris]